MTRCVRNGETVDAWVEDLSKTRRTAHKAIGFLKKQLGAKEKENEKVKVKENVKENVKEKEREKEKATVFLLPRSPAFISIKLLLAEDSYR